MQLDVMHMIYLISTTGADARVCTIVKPDRYMKIPVVKTERVGLSSTIRNSCIASLFLFLPPPPLRSRLSSSQSSSILSHYISLHFFTRTRAARWSTRRVPSLKLCIPCDILTSFERAGFAGTCVLLLRQSIKTCGGVSRAACLNPYDSWPCH